MESMTDFGDGYYAAAGLSELSQLLARSRLYQASIQYQELLEFVCRLRHFAPFNAMLLNIQKPSLLYAATAEEWERRFQRTIKPGARPLLILWPFGPVRLVYDLEDTDGPPLPRIALALPFQASGWVDGYYLTLVAKALLKKDITVRYGSMDDATGGLARRIRNPPSDAKGAAEFHYEITLNRRYDENVCFATLIHELGHIFLGHLGEDDDIDGRRDTTRAQRELEAESVSFLVCKRLGIESNAEQYMANFIDRNPAMPPVDVYAVMKAAGRVEALVKVDTGLGRYPDWMER